MADTLGSVVSVPIFQTVDTGATMLSVLIPPIILPSETATAPVATYGITAYHRISVVVGGPFDEAQRIDYGVIQLSGTASVLNF